MEDKLESHARHIFSSQRDHISASQKHISWHPHRGQTGEYAVKMGIARSVVNIWISTNVPIFFRCVIFKLLIIWRIIFLWFFLAGWINSREHICSSSLKLKVCEFSTRKIYTICLFASLCYESRPLFLTKHLLWINKIWKSEIFHTMSSW